MASTYSTNLAIELIGTGDQAGSWGNTTNTNLGTLIEQAISGYVTQAVSTGTDTTITIPNGATGVARNMYIELTGTGGTNTNLIVPANKKLYFIFNNASGAVTVKVSGQTGVSVPAGKKVVLASNGTDTVNALNYIADFGSNSATITQLTATSATITNLTLTSLVISNLSIASANITTLTSSSATISTTLALSGGTANGVLYLNGSKVATSGTALVFDGSKLGINRTPSAGYALDVDTSNGSYQRITGSDQGNVRLRFDNGGTGGRVWELVGGLSGANNADFSILDVTGGTSPLVITSTSLYTASGINVGIGTSSPGGKLAVSGGRSIFKPTAEQYAIALGRSDFTNTAYIGVANSSSNPDLVFSNNAGTTLATLTDSGNLGLGATPSAYGTRGFDIAGFVGLSQNSAGAAVLAFNNFQNGAGNYIYKTTNPAARYDCGLAGTAAHAWYIAASGTAGTAISFTQAMTLDASGNLGVGLTGPATRIHARVTADSDSQIAQFENLNTAGTDSHRLEVFADAANNFVSFKSTGSSAGGYKFITGNDERARITSGGQLLVGTTTTVISGAEIAGFQGGVGLGVRSTGGDASFAGAFWNDATTGDNVLIRFYTETAGTQRGTITYNRGGGVIAYNTTSDYRAKEVYGAVENSGEQIDALKIYRGKMKDATIERPMLIAHEAQEIVPYAVCGEKDAVDEDGKPKYQTMDHQILVPLLIAELQSLRKRVAELENK
jgi:hypothetical protein